MILEAEYILRRDAVFVWDPPVSVSLDHLLYYVHSARVVVVV